MDTNTTNDKAPKTTKKKKNGLPGWAWAVVIILPIMALFSLTMMCGAPPEQSRYANKNKNKSNLNINPKNNPQNNVKPKTNVAKFNNENKANAKANQTNAQKPVNNAAKNQTDLKPKINNNNNLVTQANDVIYNASNIANNNVANQNQIPTQNQTESQVQPNSTQIIKPQTKPQNTNTPQPADINANTASNTTNTAAAARPKVATKTPTKPAKSTNASNIKSKYKGSAAKVDIAAQTNSTEIINFGTVTNNDKVLTPSAYSNFIKISKILVDNPKATITLRTHNINFNNSPSNQKAKQQGKVRADLLKKILVDSGVEANRIKIDLIGHVEPLIQQDPSHIRNKRVTVQIN